MGTLENLAPLGIMLKTSSNILSNDISLLWLWTKLRYGLTTLDKMFDFNPVLAFVEHIWLQFSRHMETIQLIYDANRILCDTKKIVIVPSLFMLYIYLVLFYSNFDFYCYRCCCFITVYYYLVIYLYLLSLNFLKFLVN